MVLGERVMGNFKMDESGQQQLNSKINLKALKVGQLTYMPPDVIPQRYTIPFMMYSCKKNGT